jgi:molybdate transport system substrate-binding protein
VNGAPFDVLLAADDETPTRLEREGWGVPGTRFTYATGTLVLWSKQPNLVDTQGQVLKTAPFTRLAVADPKVAPYGAAALDTLAKLGLQSAWAPKLVQGDSVGQAYQFVASGNAELGFVALSQVWQDGKLKDGSAWLVPEHLHSPLRQDAVLLTPGRDNPAARALLQFLRSDHAQRVLRSYGYRP